VMVVHHTFPETRVFMREHIMRTSLKKWIAWHALS
jgi:hypothetical protein